MQNKGNEKKNFKEKLHKVLQMSWLIAKGYMPFEEKKKPNLAKYQKKLSFFSFILFIS